MCELFAMSAREPADVELSIEEFSRHGGETAPHKDGWGIAFYKDNDVQHIRDTKSATTSDWLSFVKDHQIHSDLVISHIRKATVGGLGLRNTQPFIRELGGRVHVFAHNGDVPGILTHGSFKLGSQRPVGTTDSEHGFCALLARLSELWGGAKPPSLTDRVEVVSQFAAELAPLGPANFLYSDGDALYAHGHRRTQENGRREPPGLHMLTRECFTCDDGFKAEGLTVRTRKQKVVLVASVPLSNEAWKPLLEGEILTIKGGEVLSPPDWIKHK